MQPVYDNDGIMLYQGDCLDVLPHVRPATIVVTDPPFNDGTEYGGVVDRMPDWHYACRLGDVFGACAERMGNSGSIVWLWRADFVCNGWAGDLLPRRGDWRVHRVAATSKSGDGTEWEAIIWGTAGPGPVSAKSPPITPKNQRTVTTHPAERPLSLMTGILRWVSAPGDIVLDPFAGAGTTLVAARRAGLAAVGIERHREYCDMAIERLERMRGNG